MPVLETTTLAQRLRRETEDAHLAAEAATGLPGTVGSRADYARLLGLLAAFHLRVERSWAGPHWADEWTATGITLADHTRSHLLEGDLRTLRTTPPVITAGPTSRGAGSFGALLGQLYVVEGSALGGLIIGPMIRESLGAVSTRFYDGDGRHHPRPWRSVLAALAMFDAQGGDQDHVIQGARDAFSTFSTELASPLWSAAR